MKSLDDKRWERILGTARIIGCTTTGAASYRESLAAAKPGIVMVEEAGEILEAHVLSSLSPVTKQLVMIGDHKQLRPKVETYELSVQAGTGHSLNVSLFERLVLGGYPHATLEVRAFVRSTGYPLSIRKHGFSGRMVYLRLSGATCGSAFLSHKRSILQLERAKQFPLVSLTSSPRSTSRSFAIDQKLRLSTDNK
jgi:hypothetical protein